MKELVINTSEPYHAYVGSRILGDLPQLIGNLPSPPSSVMIVTDSIVGPLYLDHTLHSLGERFETHSHVLPAGEENKTPESVIGIVRSMAKAEMTRSDLVIALGGGVVGDMAGFAAAIYQRGMRFIQVPTTLLSAVDASVGGKTAVDLPEGKNLMGAFHQPSMVVCDTDTFKTLPEMRMADGAAEMIKHGILADASLFDRMRSGLWRREIADTVIRNMDIKRHYVTEDEHDHGLRQCLNFGHTIGHALEAWSGFTLSHGQAVAIGMVMETRAARRLGISSFHEAPIKETLQANGLPITAKADPNVLYPYILHDKKRKANGITVVIPDEIGKARLYTLRAEDVPAYLAAGCTENDA